MRSERLVRCGGGVFAQFGECGVDVAVLCTYVGIVLDGGGVRLSGRVVFAVDVRVACVVRA